MCLQENLCKRSVIWRGSFVKLVKLQPASMKISELLYKNLIFKLQTSWFVVMLAVHAEFLVSSTEINSNVLICKNVFFSPSLGSVKNVNVDFL